MKKWIPTNMRYYRFTPAFTMLELVFVIVILGIVASIGSEMIAKVYESYIVQRAQHRASLKTELAATQIANRLASAIPGTIFRRTSLGNSGIIEDINYHRSQDSDAYIALQWVGADVESYNYTTGSTTYTPGWSGFCDINASSKDTIITPGSNLDFIDKLRTIFGNTHKFSIFFPNDRTAYYGSVETNNSISLDNNASHIVEHYKLARTSYALVCENGGTNFCGDLTLYYNFTPDTALTTPTIPNTAQKSILLRNVTSFKFKGAGRTIRFKICKEERLSADVNITACKEKAVF